MEAGLACLNDPPSSTGGSIATARQVGSEKPD